MITTMTVVAAVIGAAVLDAVRRWQCRLVLREHQDAIRLLAKKDSEHLASFVLALQGSPPLVPAKDRDPKGEPTQTRLGLPASGVRQ